MEADRETHEEETAPVVVGRILSPNTKRSLVDVRIARAWASLEEKRRTEDEGR